MSFLEKIQPALSVSIGGFFGAVLRAITFMYSADLTALLSVNIIGSFLIGFFLFLPAVQSNPEMKIGSLILSKPLLIGTGFFGAFTTFSFFILYPITAMMILEKTGLEFIVIFAVFVTILTLIGIAAVFAGKIAAEKLFSIKSRGKEYND